MEEKEYLLAIQRAVQQELERATGRYNPSDRQQLGLGTSVIRKLGRSYRKQVTSKATALALFRQLFDLRYYEYSIIGILIYVKFLKQFDGQDKAIILDVLEHRVADWAITDVYGLELLGPYVHQTMDLALLTYLLKHQRTWPRRCAYVVLVYLVRKRQARDFARKVLITSANENERLVKKAAQWLERELVKEEERNGYG